MLRPILSPSFAFLDGATGEIWSRDRYVETLEMNPLPSLAIDQLSIHIDGNAAVVSARSSGRPGRYSRYVDTYERHESETVDLDACLLDEVLQKGLSARRVMLKQPALPFRCVLAGLE